MGSWLAAHRSSQSLSTSSMQEKMSFEKFYFLIKKQQVAPEVVSIFHNSRRSFTRLEYQKLCISWNKYSNVIKNRQPGNHSGIVLRSSLGRRSRYPRSGEDAAEQICLQNLHDLARDT